ncbi:Hypothetical protein CAP_3066 [Chondromyces apiculatus DSM 436]|uniref:Uncharacterized protein n=1 Tax=Chondromyces apiculatus DSM 436 TaxID=1192034 RepID=A0A017TAX7_9BACT|nr:Hypothetical protein CAP_3066 [Chondromyces apiculatus DSM 436]
MEIQSLEAAGGGAEEGAVPSVSWEPPQAGRAGRQRARVARVSQRRGEAVRAGPRVFMVGGA